MGAVKLVIKSWGINNDESPVHTKQLWARKNKEAEQINTKVRIGTQLGKL